ncbi:MAG: IS1595 family transposase, partial [Tenuifilaceae bacterium]|nr:IS1595 family transposase [Tenuifilaceae bacterium]
FPDMHRAIMGFKGWLRGMHHHAEHLQAYIDEYTYRFNRNFMSVGLFENLLIRMVEGQPHTYRMIIS